MQHTENLRRGDDRTDGFSERADLRDLGGLTGARSPSVLFSCSCWRRHGSSRRLGTQLSALLQRDTLQAKAVHFNQKHLSSIEDTPRPRPLPAGWAVV
jgi:hypothetical protein